MKSIDEVYSDLRLKMNLAAITYAHNESIRDKAPVDRNKELAELTKKQTAMRNDLNYMEIERTQPKRFLYWLLDNNADSPADEIIKILSMLNITGYPVAVKDSDGKSILNYFVKHRFALPILEHYFLYFSCIIIEFNDEGNPLLEKDLSDEVLRCLIVNFMKFNNRLLIPANYAISKNNMSLLSRILTIVPSELNSFSSQGINPLTHAILLCNEPIIRYIFLANAEINFRNNDGNTLAHLVFLVIDKFFLKKIIFDPSYAFLNLKQGILDINNRNDNALIPAFYALERGHYEIFEFILANCPAVAKEFPLFCSSLTISKDTSALTYLHERGHFTVNSDPEFFDHFLNTVLLNKKTQLLSWLCKAAYIDTDIKKAIMLILAIIEKSPTRIRQILGDRSINWDAMMPTLPLKITELLIAFNFDDLLVEFDLFFKSDSFIYYRPNVFSKNFLNFVMTDYLTPKSVDLGLNHRKLIEYFCRYLNSKQEVYPDWIHSFGDTMFFVERFLYQIDIDVFHEPLVHYIEDYLAKKMLSGEKDVTFYETEMKKIIMKPNANFNKKDHYGVHIVAKLIEKQQFSRLMFLIKNLFDLDLEELDTLHSNLLHLACEHNFIDAVRWSIKENLSLNYPRTIDNLLPIELAFANQHTEIVMLLRKQIKPGNFMDFLKHLINNKNEALLLFLVENGMFAFKFSKHHENLIKSLANPILNEFFVEKPKPTISLPEITLAPVAIEPMPTKAPELNQSALNCYRELLNKDNLEKLNNLTKLLRHEIYQEPLREIFGDNIVSYALKILESKSTGLIKQFFRIPVVSELMSLKWSELLAQTHVTELSLVIDAISEHHCSEDTFEFILNSNLSLSEEFIDKVIQHILANFDTKLFSTLCSNKYGEQYLLTNSIIILMSTFTNERLALHLLSHPIFQMQLANEDNTLLKHALSVDSIAIVKKLLNDLNVRQQFKKTGFSTVQTIIDNFQEEMISLFVEIPDLWCILEQFTEIRHMFSQIPIEHVAIKMTLPTMVNLQDLSDAIQIGNLDLFIELYASCTVTAEIAKQLMQAAVTHNNTIALQYITARHMDLIKETSFVHELLEATIYAGNANIFNFLISLIAPSQSTSLFDYDLLAKAIFAERLEICSSILQTNPTSRFSVHNVIILLCKAIEKNHAVLIFQILAIDYVYRDLSVYNDCLIAKTHEHGNIQLMFHLLSNHVFLKNSLKHPIVQMHLGHFTSFFIASYLGSSNINIEQKNIALMLSEQPHLAQFHPQLKLIKQAFFQQHRSNDGDSRKHGKKFSSK